MTKNYKYKALTVFSLGMIFYISACQIQKSKTNMNKELYDRIKNGEQLVTIGLGNMGIDLVKIMPGEFMMGSPASEIGHNDNEKPIRKVQITNAYYIGKYELTQAQFWAFEKDIEADKDANNLPVTQIKYSQAITYCQRLSDTLNLKVRLPTEAEWEYACRAGTTTRFNTGESETDLEESAWFKKNAEGKVHAVGQKRPNEWGLFDMHGNAWEYCHDFIEDYQNLAEINPVGLVSPTRGAMRGGGWMHGAEYCRSASRLISDDMFGGGGFRIVIEVDK